jgi:biotin carboxylase
MKKRVMVVTASRQQAPIILKAKELGFEVLATDVQADAPAFALADHSAIVDATEPEELLRVACKFRPSAVLSEQTDVAVPAVAFVAEQLGLPGIGCETALRATDKWRMREACRNAGLPTPQCRLVTTLEHAIAAIRDIGLPVVVKPTDGQASRGVTKVTDMAAIPTAVAAALAASRSARALVEECMIGQESSIESFVIGDAVHVLGICEKVKCAPPYSFDLQLTYPAMFPAKVMAEIAELNRQVIKAIGIRMGFAHAEVMVTDQGVRLIEVAARGCGARVATDLLPALTAVDLLGLRLRQSAGEPIHMPPMRNDQVGILRFFQFPAGTVRRVRGLREAAAIPGVVCIEFTPQVSDRLRPPVSGDQRPGYVLAVASSREQAIATADKVTDLVAVDMI